MLEVRGRGAEAEASVSREIWIEIDVADKGPDDVEHVLIADLVTRDLLSVKNANKIAARLQRTATFKRLKNPR